MILVHNTLEVFQQLVHLLEQLDNADYQRPIPQISGNSVGKHVRHLIEFYLELLKGIPEGVVNYDQRKRSLTLESDTIYAIQQLQQIINSLMHVSEDKPIALHVALSVDGTETIVQSTVGRELAYNIEHMIHHFALLKIAMFEAMPHVTLPEHFGVAYATIKYQTCAQ